MAHLPQSASDESQSWRRSLLPLLMGLLFFELIGWGALYWGLDRKLGFGVRFWGLVVLVLAACVMVWMSLRALILRRGWFTLTEFLLFVLLVGCALGWAGHFYQQAREQRSVAQFLAERNSSSQWRADDDEPGWRRLIPLEYRSGIRHVFIDLSQITAEELAVLGRLPELDGLQLYGSTGVRQRNELTADHIRNLEKVPSLRFVAMDRTEIIGPALAPLRGHNGLQSLRIAPTRLDVGALSPLPAIPNLTYLSLEGQSITDESLMHVGNCRQLETLNLFQTAVTGAGLVHLNNAPRLATLGLYGTPLGDDDIVQLATIDSLVSLDLSATRVTDDGLRNLTSLKQLRTLVLHETKVTHDGVRRLESELPQLRVSR